MTGNGKLWGVCIAAVLIIAIAGIPVSAAGSGKLAVPPGLGNVWRYGGSNFDFAWNIQKTFEGGYILIGESNSNGGDIIGNHGGYDIWVRKLTSELSPEWSRCYGGSLDENGGDIQQTVDGGYILLGTTSSTDVGVPNHGGKDIWVVKLNQGGSMVYQACLGGSNDDESGVRHSIQQTSDGGYILIGATKSTGVDGIYNHDITGLTYDMWVVKLTPNLAIQWQKCIGGSADDGVAGQLSIEQTTDGGYILTGNTVSNDGDIGGFHGSMDVFVAKLSEDGVFEWKRTLGGSINEGASIVRQTADGGYLFTGTTNSDDGDLTGLELYADPGTNWDAWIEKMSPTGGTQWHRLIGGWRADTIQSLQITSDNGFIIMGYSGSSNGDVIGSHGGDEMWMVKLNSAGIPLWQKCIGGTSDDYGYSIQQTPGNGYLLCGHTYSTDGDLSGTTNHGLADIFLVKLYGPPVVNGIAPARVATGATTTVVFTGENLVQNGVNPTVTFYKPGTQITVPIATSAADGTRITCDITPATFPLPGVYNVRVKTQDNQYVTLSDAFTVTCGPAPTISSISPTSGVQGAVLNPVVIKGTKFWTTGGITAYLNRTGQPNITIAVTAGSATQLNGNFTVPAGAATGKWNLVVTNPDGQYAMKKDAFTVNVRTFKPPRVSSVTPRTVTAGGAVYINSISGSFFNASATVAMTGPRGVSIPVSNVTVLSDTKITCDANLTLLGKGYGTVTVTNPDGKKSTRSRAFVIK